MRLHKWFNCLIFGSNCFYFQRIHILKERLNERIKSSQGTCCTHKHAVCHLHTYHHFICNNHLPQKLQQHRLNINDKTKIINRVGDRICRWTNTKKWSIYRIIRLLFGLFTHLNVHWLWDFSEMLSYHLNNLSADMLFFQRI